MDHALGSVCSGESPIARAEALSQISLCVIGATDTRGAFLEAAQWALSGSLVTLMSAERPASDANRYAARPAGAEWCVWDLMRDALVFGAERMAEEQARVLACQLSAAYRRTAPNEGETSSHTGSCGLAGGDR